MYHAWARIRVLASPSIRLLSFSNCFSFETKGRSAPSVLLRLKDTLDSLSRVGSEVCGFSAAVDLELHEKGEGINFANVWNESLERPELTGETRVWEEEVWSTITPSGVGGLGLMSWVDDTYWVGLAWCSTVVVGG
jgi:hypothetical protein